MSNFGSRSLVFRVSWSSFLRFVQLFVLPFSPTSEAPCLERNGATLSGLELRRGFDSPAILLVATVSHVSQKIEHLGESEKR